MVSYANYLLPISYAGHTHTESHLNVRTKTGVFDVSHMLQHKLKGKESIDFIQKLIPTDIQAIPVGTSHLSTFLNKDAGVIDDTIITKVSDNELYFVSNGATTEKVGQFLSENLNSYKNGNHDLTYGCFKKALVAVQGPTSASHMSKLLNVDLKNVFFGNHFFLQNGEKVVGKGFVETFSKDSNGLLVSRSGYTGEDGFEISIPNDEVAVEFVEKLLAEEGVEPTGLAARDSLRLEAGMCLYGNELTESITPIEASLNWIVSKSRRNDPEGFNGAARIIEQLNDKTKVPYKRVGFSFSGGAAARNGSKIYVKEGEDLKEVGFVTSGSQSPSLSDKTGEKVNIGQGYVKMPFNKKGTDIMIQIRKNTVGGTIQKLPFIAPGYYKET